MNKRKNERRNCAVPVDSREGSLFDKSKTIDISKGGLGFISKNVIPLHKEIPIEIDINEDSDPVFVVGKVEWVEPMADSSNFRVGISFNQVLDGSKSRLIQYFRK